MNGKQTTTQDNELSPLERELAGYSQLNNFLTDAAELRQRRLREREFAKVARYDFSLGWYWEDMTLEELRKVQQS